MPLRGSGTAGTAPEWGKLLRCCTYQETITATAVGVPTAAAAGTTNTLTLATPFAATAQLYRGMPLLLTGDRIRAYHDWGTGVAQGKITYVRPAFRRQKLCDITWELTVDLLKQRGVIRLVYTVLASATAMKAACDKRGDRLVSHRYLREL